ncbi:AraC-type DNA-binding protein [Streptococcus gallolyticus]|uniref:AraC-type DNA-binding protein n=2 Tax=Streptococcus gallolyticus TaxID=315405 RepID=A0A1I7EUT7_9STRE|nr:AraC family transcriptional regulator [Streptococcus gallolyticus]SFB95927.1 AraC-type DNA-binding protein [Streptococcus gallolyticus]SFU27705.1 AraC-type DNA-binding protein [Streptococcus gallolyticus]
MNLSQNTLKRFQNLYEMSQIPFTLFSLKDGPFYSFPVGLEKFYDVNFWKQNRGTPTDREHYFDGVSLFERAPLVFSVIWKLDPQTIFVTALIRTHPEASLDFIHEPNIGFTSKHITAFHRLLLSIPCQNLAQLKAFGELAYFLYHQEMPEGLNIHYQNSHQERHQLSQEKSPNAFELSQQTPLPANTPKTPTKEEAIFQTIASGNLYELEHLLQAPNTNIRQLSHSQLQQARYHFIANITLGQNAAISAGIPWQSMQVLGDYFYLQMDQLETIQAIENYEHKCLREICQKVQQKKGLADLSYYTHLAVDIIHSQLNQALTVSNLAKQVGVNRSSLTHYFKVDLNLTPAAYILQEKLKESCRLLIQTNISIQEISELLAFSSQSHFTERFKETYGITPKQYRVRLK